jgi:hypothetical protein
MTKTSPVPVLDRLAYSIPNFAAAVDLSVEQVRKHIARGDLTPSYSGSKPLISREEGQRFLEALPAEPLKAAG